jgi:hypothetical protein
MRSHGNAKRKQCCLDASRDEELLGVERRLAACLTIKLPFAGGPGR